MICVYDVTNRSSFDRLSHWLTELKTYATKPDLVQMLVGNKVRSSRSLSL